MVGLDDLEGLFQLKWFCGGDLFHLDLHNTRILFGNKFNHEVSELTF